jgi:hypothetical protein
VYLFVLFFKVSSLVIVGVTFVAKTSFSSKFCSVHFSFKSVFIFSWLRVFCFLGGIRYH